MLLVYCGGRDGQCAGLAEAEEVVVVAEVVAGVVLASGSWAEEPSLGLALVLGTAEEDVRRLPLFPLAFPDDCSRLSPWPRPVGLPA